MVYKTTYNWFDKDDSWIEVFALEDIKLQSGMIIQQGEELYVSEAGWEDGDDLLPAHIVTEEGSRVYFFVNGDRVERPSNE